jgi:hypothetical protein
MSGSKTLKSAQLTNWRFKRTTMGFIILGNIFNDEAGRFKDGEHIRTSLVKDFFTKKSGCVTTVNTRYFLSGDPRTTEVKKCIP